MLLRDWPTTRWIGKWLLCSPMVIMPSGISFRRRIQQCSSITVKSMLTSPTFSFYSHAVRPLPNIFPLSPVVAVQAATSKSQLPQVPPSCYPPILGSISHSRRTHRTTSHYKSGSLDNSVTRHHRLCVVAHNVPGSVCRLTCSYDHHGSGLMSSLTKPTLHFPPSRSHFHHILTGSLP